MVAGDEIGWIFEYGNVSLFCCGYDENVTNQEQSKFKRVIMKYDGKQQMSSRTFANIK